mgnify:CR=1 FL=1
MDLAERLLQWYKDHGRHDLPWQVRGDPYPVWVSEIMLQQTQVATVIPYYLRFIEQLPQLQDLANAELDTVLHHWSGLGYYARARNLHKTAKIISTEYDGLFPTDIDALISLPGIGKSTAGAILALSLGQRHPILDGNVKRVLSRYYLITGWPGHREIEKQLWQLSDENTPEKEIAEYTQAIMDLGATICTRSKPDCTNCPLQNNCQARLTDQIHACPGKRPKKVMPVKTATFLMLKNKHDEIYLTQRPPSGIWGGLWCLPELKHDSAASWDHDQSQLDIDPGPALPVIRHTFSHYHLDFTVIPAMVKGNQSVGIMESAPAVWYNPDNPPELGLAAPIKKLIHSKEVQNGKNG